MRPKAAAADEVAVLLGRAEQQVRDRAFHAARRLLRRAVERDTTPRSLIAMGRLLAQSGAMEEAASALLRAAQWATELSAPQFCVGAWQELARLLRRQGDALAARQYQQLALAAEMETCSGILSDGSLLGCAYDWMGCGEADAALNLFQRVTSTELRGEANLGAGIACLSLGQFPAARRRLNAAWGAFHLAGDATGIVCCLEAFAGLAEAEGDWDLAVTWYEAAIGTAEQWRLTYLLARLGRARDRAEHVRGLLASPAELN